MTQRIPYKQHHGKLPFRPAATHKSHTSESVLILRTSLTSDYWQLWRKHGSLNFNTNASLCVFQPCSLLPYNFHSLLYLRNGFKLDMALMLVHIAWTELNLASTTVWPLKTIHPVWRDFSKWQPSWIFTARRSYASAVFGVIILSVCPSVCLLVTRVLSD